jgi:hypothetical protein
MHRLACYLNYNLKPGGLAIIRRRNGKFTRIFHKMKGSLTKFAIILAIHAIKFAYWLSLLL